MVRNGLSWERTWVVGSINVFCFHPETWGIVPIWIYNRFEMGWNHQPGTCTPKKKTTASPKNSSPNSARRQMALVWRSGEGTRIDAPCIALGKTCRSANIKFDIPICFKRKWIPNYWHHNFESWSHHFCSRPIIFGYPFVSFLGLVEAKGKKWWEATRRVSVEGI